MAAPDETDLSIGIALGAGMNKTEVAEFLGIDRKTVYNREEANPEYIGLVAAKVKAATASSIAATIEKARAKISAELLPEAVENLKFFLGSLDMGDKKFATKEVLDRSMGKAAQTIDHNHTGAVEQRHTFYEIPADEFSILRQLSQRTARLQLTATPVNDAITVDPE